MWLNLAVKIATACTEDELDYRHPGKIISMSIHTKKTGGAAGAPPPNVWCLLVSFHFTHEPNTSRDDFCQAFWPPKRHVAAKWSGSEVICIYRANYSNPMCSMFIHFTSIYDLALQKDLNIWSMWEWMNFSQREEFSGFFSACQASLNGLMRGNSSCPLNLTRGYSLWLF